jgi:hypothetical protein
VKTYTSRITSNGVVSCHVDTPIILVRHSKHVLLKCVDIFCFFDKRVGVVGIEHCGGVSVYIASEAPWVGTEAVRTRVWRNICEDLADGSKAHCHTRAESVCIRKMETKKTYFLNGPSVTQPPPISAGIIS